MNAWQQTQRYLVDIMHRDMFGLNELPLKSAFLTSNTSLKERARYKIYLNSRRSAMLKAEERAGDLQKKTLALDGVQETATTTSLVAFLNVQVWLFCDSLLRYEFSGINDFTLTLA
jgi:hypothetical protein